MKYIESLRKSLEDIIREKNAFLIGEDIMEPYGGAFKVTKGLSDKFPDNIIGVPMSEQGFTAMGVGMALCGDYVIEEIMFGDFITLAADQLINHAAKFYELYNQPLHYVLRTPSGGYRGYGATHSQSLEKMFLGIPGINVIAANILTDVGAMLKNAIGSGKPTLFIENKLDYAQELILTDFDIFLRKEKEGNVRVEISGESPEVTIITYGGLTTMMLECIKELIYEEEVVSDLIVVSNLSSDDEYIRVKNLLRTQKVLIVEEGTGGYGFSAQWAYDLSKCGYDTKVLTSENRVISASKQGEDAVLVQKRDVFQKIVQW